MKWFRLLFVLFVLIQPAGPWGWEDAVGDEIVRQGVLIPYEITGPAGWVYQSEPHQYVLGVFRPEDDDLYPYISLTVVGGAFQTMREEIHRQYISPEALVEANLYERPGARLLSSRWLGEGEDSFLLAEFSWSSELGELRSTKAFHPWRDMVLVVTASCLSADYDEYQEALLESVMSLRVKQFRDPEEKPADTGSGGDDWLYDE